jgi:adenylate cyclase
MKKGKWRAAVGCGLLAWGMAAGLEASGWLASIEGAWWNVRVRATARPSPSTDRVRLILLDQYSLDWAHKEMSLPWPWPREIYAAMLGLCERGGAKGVAFDMIFTEPSYMGVADDEAFGAAVADTTGFAGALSVGATGGAARPDWPEAAPRRAAPIEGLEAWLAREGPRVRAEGAVFPIPEVTGRAVQLGDVQGLPDSDGVFRRTSVFRVFDGAPVYSLGFALWQAAAAAREELFEARMEGSDLVLAGRRIPLDRDGGAALRYRGPADVYPTVNAAAVIQSHMALELGEGTPSIDPEWFRDAYVFFGASAPGLMDLRPTPLSPITPGVVVHATALDNFLEGDFVRRPSAAAVAAGMAALLFLAAFVVILPRRVGLSAVGLVIALGLALAAGHVAAAAGWWIPVISPLAGTLFAGLAGLGYNYATEGRQKAFVKQAFRHYLGPEVIEQIIDDPSRLKLGGEKRELTIFFSDIEKFSSFSERLDPPALTALLNEYLTEMSGIIMDEGGYVDKYIGDAIVAFWNAPLPQADHAVRAVRAALRAQQRLDERRADWEARFGAVLRMRVGLHTGEVIVGNMGSESRFNYTILGDAANLASRLEGVNKVFHTYILASEQTWTAAAPADFSGRALARVRVVGRAAPVRVFEPLALPGGAAPATAGAFDRARTAMEEGRFAEAAAAFRALADDPAAAALAARCDGWAASPPADWDGVMTLAEK